MFVQLEALKTKEDKAQSCPRACLEKQWVWTGSSLSKTPKLFDSV